MLHLAVIPPLLLAAATHQLALARHRHNNYVVHHHQPISHINSHPVVTSPKALVRLPQARTPLADLSLTMKTGNLLPLAAVPPLLKITLSTLLNTKFLLRLHLPSQLNTYNHNLDLPLNSRQEGSFLDPQK